MGKTFNADDAIVILGGRPIVPFDFENLYQTVMSQGGPFCGMCGKIYTSCECLAEIKLDDNYTSPWAKPKPKPIPAPLPPPVSEKEAHMSRVQARIERAMFISGQQPPCYLCAKHAQTMVRVKNGGMIICEPCAVEHLGG